MSDIARVEQQNSRELDHYDPKRHRLMVAALEYGIEEAKRIKDWPKLEEAVDFKIAEQCKFVAWWGANVRRKGERANNRAPGYFVDDAEALTGIRQQRVSDLRSELKKPDKYRIKQLGAAYIKAKLEAAENHRAEGTGENEWYTPAKYIELAREVLGAIDLDPATNAKAQAFIHAAQFFTKIDDGLKRKWHGRVWLNPPYTQPEIALFSTKMVEERRAGRVLAAIMLTHNYTDTAWFHELTSVADAICFTRGRVKFIDEDGNECAPTQGQAFFYFGSDISKFREKFVNVGFVVVPMSAEILK
jgi:phage N-6-adenine-methyltransferase